MRSDTMKRALHTVSLAAAAGVALGVTPAPREEPATAFVAIAFLLYAVRGPEGGSPSVRRGFVAGFLTSFIVNAMALYWVVGLLEAFAGFPTIASIPTASLLFAAQALPFAFACAGAAALSAYRVPLWVVLPPALTVMASLSPTLFPWRIANSQSAFTPYLQLAEIGGQPILDLAVAYVGAGLGHALVKRSAPALAVAVLAFALPVAYGLVRLPEVEAARAAAPVLRVGVVQPNVSIFEKHDRRLAPAHLAELQLLTAELEARGAELVVWPETAYPFPIPRRAERDALGPMRVFGRGVRGPVLVGAITIAPDGARYNSAVAYDRDGTRLGIADKVELLAFGEYVPLWDYLPPVQERFPRGLTAGEAPRVLEIAGARVAVLNCYEDVLDQYAIRVGRDAPDLLVNVTNDAWFGDTAEPWLHEAVSRMRAIETRRDLVRAVNTGVSSHTAATGEPLFRTGTFEDAAFIARVALLDGVTPWVRFGDWVTPLLVGALLGTALGAARRRPLA
jgi:apolipoprotein N-acyltransferase